MDLEEYIDRFKQMAVTESILDPKDGSYMSLLCKERQMECWRVAEWLEELKKMREQNDI